MKGRHSTRGVFFAVSGLLICWSLHLALADEVRLKNGDRLTGTVVSLAKGRLRVTTAYAGDLVIQWDAVATLKTDRPMLLDLRSGERWIGWIEPDEVADVVVLSGTGTRALQLAALVALRPLNDDEERQHANALTKPALWKHRLEAGAQVRSGNTESTDVVVSYHGRRQSSRSEFAADIGATYGETEGERTAQQAHAGGRLDLLHTERFFSFYLVSLEHDALEDLNLRAQELAGVGYKFIRTSRTQVQGEVGFGAREELFKSGDSEIEPVGRIGGKWTQQIGTASELSLSAAFLPDLIDRGQYRMEAEASASTPITNRFMLRLSLLDSYDSEPQPGVKNNDLTLLSSIAWTF